MGSSQHLNALKTKHDKLEETIQQEMAHPGHDDALIAKIKKEKLYLKEEIERLQESTQH